MRRTILPFLACGMVLAAACAAPPASAPSPSSVGSERLLVEGDGQTTIIDVASGAVAATLPGGIASPSGLVVRLEAGAGTTAVRGVDLDGLPMLKVDLAGSYALPSAYGASPSGFSPNGRWLVLVAREGGQSRFAIIDTDRSKLVDTVTLGERFSFDAIHNDGSAMYLIEHPVAGATSYNVRLYDLRAKTLMPDIIFDKAQVAQWDPTVGLMDGTFHVSVAPKRGEWSYGLYMRPNGTPFVHALNVPGRYATCIIDLEGKANPSSRFALALRDDGRWLYVVDTALGTASMIDADTQKVTRRATFAGRPGESDARTASALVSKDGTRVFASGARGIAILSGSDLSLRGWVVTDLAVRSLSSSADGKRVYALSGDVISAIDASTGAVLSRVASVAGARAIHVLASP